MDFGHDFECSVEGSVKGLGLLLSSRVLKHVLDDGLLSVECYCPKSKCQGDLRQCVKVNFKSHARAKTRALRTRMTPQLNDYRTLCFEELRNSPGPQAEIARVQKRGESARVRRSPTTGSQGCLPKVGLGLVLAPRRTFANDLYASSTDCSLVSY